MKQKAFTLIELAIVLVIIGVLMGGSASLFTMLTKRTKVTQTKQDLDAAVEAVVGYVATHGYLPKQDEFPQVVRTNKDSWEQNFFYIPDSNLIDDDVCYRRTTDLNIIGDKNISDVAFIIVSSGPNYNMQTALDASTTPNQVNIHRAYEPNVDDNATDRVGNRPEDYDDIARWVTLNELRIKAGCQGSQIKILNTTLPDGEVNQSYKATIYADGGIEYDDSYPGKYCWCAEYIQGEWSSADFNITSDNNNSVLLIQKLNDNGCLKENENDWRFADKINITGTPSPDYPSPRITVYVADNNDPDISSPIKDGNDNIASKIFVITIHRH